MRGWERAGDGAYQPNQRVSIHVINLFIVPDMNHEHCLEDVDPVVIHLRERGDEGKPFADLLEGHKSKLTEHYEALRVATGEVPPNKDTMASLKSTIDSASAAFKIDSIRITKAFGIVKPKATAKSKTKAGASAAGEVEQHGNGDE